MRFIGDFWHKIELPYIYSLANSKIPIRFGMVDDELGSIRFWSLTKRPVKRSEVKFGGNFFHALYDTMFCRLFLISRPVVATGRKNGCAQICSLQICKCWGVLKYMAKMVNATIAYQKWLGKRGIYHVCHNYIYSSVSTCLQRICKEQICANPFLLSRVRVRWCLEDCNKLPRIRGKINK